MQCVIGRVILHMTVLSYDPAKVVELAGNCLDKLKNPGAVLLLPTETVYGLVCRWEDSRARDGIYGLKGRCGNKPLGMFVSGPEMLEPLGVIITETLQKLLAEFCPGPLTIVIPIATGGKIGFRIPAHPLILELLKICGGPLAQTSANRSGKPNALTVADAIRELDGEPELVVDAGTLSPDVKASTVMEISGDNLKILRHGVISGEDIRKSIRV